MEKGVLFIWDDACQQAFEEIKWYLTHPYSYGVRKTFPDIHSAIDHSIGSLLTQNNEQGHEQATTTWVEPWSELNIDTTWSNDCVIPRAFSLTEPSSNNVAEYNALLIGMQIVDEIGVKHLEVYGDSELIVNQACGEHKIRHEDLVPYHNTTIHMA